MVELVELEATAEGTMVETLRVVEPKDAVEPVRTVIVEWLDERTFRSTEFRSTEMAGDSSPARAIGPL